MSAPRTVKKKIPIAQLGPIGNVDLPPYGDFGANNAVHFEGWALDRTGIDKVTLEREPRPGDVLADLNARGLIPLGVATPLLGSRPDVKRTHPDYPNLHKACWVFELRREVISSQNSFRTNVHVIAHNLNGVATVLGVREINFMSPGSAPPYIFCGRPFDAVFIEPNGDVKPYPDCRPTEPFGSLTEPGATLESIWFGEKFRALRQSIIDRDPPPMCLNCAHFINRNVNDPDYFDPR